MKIFEDYKDSSAEKQTVYCLFYWGIKRSKGIGLVDRGMESSVARDTQLIQIQNELEVKRNFTQKADTHFRIATKIKRVKQ